MYQNKSIRASDRTCVNPCGQSTIYAVLIAGGLITTAYNPALAMVKDSHVAKTILNCYDNQLYNMCDAIGDANLLPVLHKHVLTGAFRVLMDGTKLCVAHIEKDTLHILGLLSHTGEPLCHKTLLANRDSVALDSSKYGITKMQFISTSKVLHRWIKKFGFTTSDNNIYTYTY